MGKVLFVMMWAICLVSNLCFATFDVAADFSTTNNPNGVWSYGWSSTLISEFNMYLNHDKFSDTVPIDVWAGSNLLYSTPNVAHNGTGNPVTTHPTITWETGQFSLHPGEYGEYSHARWTALEAGTFNITGEFMGIDILGTTTDVHVILHNVHVIPTNNFVLFEGSVNGYGTTLLFSNTVSVGIGDIIDFAVGYGYGDNPSHTCDTTALSVTIIPEPATLLLFTLGSFIFKRKNIKL